MTGSYKVFITDDHYMVIEGIRSLLAKEKKIEWMGHAMTASSCMAFISRQQPDVLLLDIHLPDKSGIELCAEIRKKFPAVKILGLSSFNQLSFIRKMLDSGASGYLLKNAGKNEILEAIEAVMNNRSYLSQEVVSLLNESRHQNVPVITRREKEVLQLIAEGLTNADIAEKLFISAATVDTHRTSLLSKFEVRNTATLIRKATQLGFL
ncbi:MAG: response regulator [Bacteroidota bacterium]